MRQMCIRIKMGWRKLALSQMRLRRWLWANLLLATPFWIVSAQTISAALIGASLGAAGQLALYNRLRTY